MSNEVDRSPKRMPSGTKLAIVIVVVGIATALIAHQFRVFTPATTRPAATR
jgi:hypothetical protein